MPVATARKRGVSLIEYVADGKGADLESFVRSHAFDTFYRRRGKPCLVEGFVSSLPRGGAIGTIDEPFAALEHAIGKANKVHCLFSGDNTHFFHGTAEHKQCTFERVINDSLLGGSSTKLYCRLRPMPKGISKLLGGAQCSKFADSERTAMFKEDLCACWIGSQGVVTPLHFDTCHGLLVCLHGTKRVTLFPPSDTRYLYRADGGSVNPNSSKCGVYEDWRSKKAEARKKWSKLEECTPREVFLRAGETLYIPPGWWHLVEGETATVALLMPFDMDSKERLHDSLLF